MTPVVLRCWWRRRGLHGRRRGRRRRRPRAARGTAREPRRRPRDAEAVARCRRRVRARARHRSHVQQGTLRMARASRSAAMGCRAAHAGRMGRPSRRPTKRVRARQGQGQGNGCLSCRARRPTMTRATCAARRWSCSSASRRFTRRSSARLRPRPPRPPRGGRRRRHRGRCGGRAKDGGRCGRRRRAGGVVHARGSSRWRKARWHTPTQSPPAPSRHAPATSPSSSRVPSCSAAARQPSATFDASGTRLPSATTRAATQPRR